MGEQVYFGFLLPIMITGFGLSFAFLIMWLDYRKKKDIYEMNHKERMTALEKGIELPPTPREFFSPGVPLDAATLNLRRALVLIFTGVAFFVVEMVRSDDAGWWGLIPVAIGAAFFVVYLVVRRQPPTGRT
jgi:Domain of unknown function (DUF6249)